MITPGSESIKMYQETSQDSQHSVVLKNSHVHTPPGGL